MQVVAFRSLSLSIRVRSDKLIVTLLRWGRWVYFDARLRRPGRVEEECGAWLKAAGRSRILKTPDTPSAGAGIRRGKASRVDPAAMMEFKEGESGGMTNAALRATKEAGDRLLIMAVNPLLLFIDIYPAARQFIRRNIKSW